MSVMSDLETQRQENSGKPQGMCRWFHKCKNPSVFEHVHPILGKVPICDRCMNNMMKATDFSNEGLVYDMPTILYRLLFDLNDGINDSESMHDNPADAINEWDIPMGDLLCIQGKWLDAGFGANGDPTLPDWEDLGVDDSQIKDGCGVSYIGNHMIIMGDTGMCACYWIFKKV